MSLLKHAHQKLCYILDFVRYLSEGCLVNSSTYIPGFVSPLMTKFLTLNLALALPQTGGLSASDSVAQTLSRDQDALIVNSDFETGNLKGWQGWRTKRSQITTDAYSGTYALEMGPGRARSAQLVKIRPNSRYRLSSHVRTESGAEEVQLIISNYGGAKLSVSSALTQYNELSLEFISAFTADEVLIMLSHPYGAGRGYVDSVRLTYLGEAPPIEIQSFIEESPRDVLTEGGAVQKSDAEMSWFFDAKFGMFIHWGVYSAMDEGHEWVMHNETIPHDPYKLRAENPTEGFTAQQYDPEEWAALAKQAGMRYMVLTARHHDGYALFNSQHPNSWTSVRHLGRDLIREYTDAVRASGLHVGLYYSPMSWRYPGYYDVTGEKVEANIWGYETAAWHKENARVMKEEVYEQVGKLLSEYRPIDYMFWDGAWLGQTVGPELEDRFWDSGLYQNPMNEWPVDEAYIEREPESKKALGIMGLVRKFQPDMLVNERFSWIGDVHAEEGGSPSAGLIRTSPREKCMSLIKGGWGYAPNKPVFSFEEIAIHLSGCAVRNINLLLNVAPDREGRIPENQAAVLKKLGLWLERTGEAIYETRGGPWQPLFGEYGFTYRDHLIFAHVFSDYRHAAQNTFTTQSIGNKQVSGVSDLATGNPLPWKRNRDNTITIQHVDYTINPAVTLLQITLTEKIY